MSDTSIISTMSTDSNENCKVTDYNHHSSFWNRYWFHIITTFLSLIILIVTIILIYVLYKQQEHKQKRRQIHDEFKRKHGVINKVLDLITKDGIVAKWLKANKGPISTAFKELMTDMLETISDQ